MDHRAACFAGSESSAGGVSFAWHPSVPGMYAVSNQRSIQFSRRPESASQEDELDKVMSDSPGNVTSLSFSPAGGKLAAVSSGNQACLLLPMHCLVTYQPCKSPARHLNALRLALPAKASHVS